MGMQLFGKNYTGRAGFAVNLIFSSTRSQPAQSIQTIVCDAFEATQEIKSHRSNAHNLYCASNK